MAPAGKLKLNYPLVLEFTRAASMHQEAAKLLLQATAPAVGNPAAIVNWEVMYLSGCAVECSLRAWYLSLFSPREHPRLINEVFKKRVQHELEKLRQVLEEEGSRLPPEQLANFRRVRSRWSSDMRYAPQTKTRDVAIRAFEAASGLNLFLMEG